MTQTPLNAQGGTAAVERVRLPDETLARVVRLAARRRRSRSAVLREAITLALDALERDTGPPDDGGG